MTETTNRLCWGLQPPEEATIAWGARAIYKYHPSAAEIMIDLLHDRQSTIGEQTELCALLDWVNETALPALKRELSRRAVTGECSETVRVVSSKGFAIDASPNASYGYLYIVAYVQPVAA
jgi:hypothetical protein